MSKTKILLGIGLILLIVLGAITAWFFYKSSGQEEITPLAESPFGPNEEGIGEKDTYKDAAGFSFSYPKNLTVTDKTPDDPDYYSLLSLENAKDKIEIHMLDTKYKTTQEWIENDNSAPKGAILSGAVSFGGVSAQQFTAPERILTLGIDQGVLFLVNGPKDGYWERAQDLILTSFSFAKPAQAASGSSSENTIYEEEEVVE